MKDQFFNFLKNWNHGWNSFRSKRIFFFKSTYPMQIFRITESQIKFSVMLTNSLNNILFHYSRRESSYAKGHVFLYLVKFSTAWNSAAWRHYIPLVYGKKVASILDKFCNTALNDIFWRSSHTDEKPHHSLKNYRCLKIVVSGVYL